MEFFNLIQIIWSGDFLGYSQTLGLHEDSFLVGIMLTIHNIIS